MKRKYLLITTLAIALVMTIVVCTAIGAADLSLSDIVRYIFTGIGLTDTERQILVHVRLSRILLAGLVGFSLAVAGTVFQALLKNPLADPFIIGVSSGAALGAILALSLGAGLTLLGFGAVPVFSFVGGFLALLLVYRVARTGTVLHAHSMLLSGVVVNAFFSAIIMFIISVSEANRLQGIMFWLMGNLGFIDYSRLAMIAGYVLVSVGILFAYARELDLLAFGDETALQLGVEVEKVKRILFFATALMVGAIVSVSGLVGFVGLIVPHMVRLVIGPRHRYLLPAAALFGAIFLVISDTIARTILDPVEIPVGVITAMLGGPFFIYLFKKGRSIF
jgi:iron complex transport system permease protein